MSNRSKKKIKLPPVPPVLILRIISLPLLIKIFFVAAFGSVLIIELFLKRYPAKYHFMFSTGDIYLKLCYSICAAIIFYFINQHLPKEKRKLKSINLISNRLVKIHQEIYFLVKSLNVKIEQQNFTDVQQKMINHACNKINPSESISSPYDSATPFVDWYEYLNYKTEKIRSLTNDLLSLSDLIDPACMYYIYSIDNAVRELRPGRKRSSNLDWSSDIWTLMIDSEEALRNRGKNWHYLEKEHRKNFIKNREAWRYLPDED